MSSSLLRVCRLLHRCCPAFRSRSGGLLLATALGVHLSAASLLLAAPNSVRLLIVAEAAALAGTLLTFGLLCALLAPADAAGDALRRFLHEGEVPDAPTQGIEDGYGSLLTDAARAVGHCAEARTRLERRSLCDALTGLPDRRAAVERLVDRVYRAERSSEPVRFCAAVIVADGLKAINDKYGHDSGDAVLRTLAQHLTGALKEEEWSARWCGAEFLLILNRPEEECHALLEALRRSLPEVYQVGGAVSVRFTVSGGVAPYRPGDTPGILLRQAEAALEEAKNAGRDRITVAASHRRSLLLSAGFSGGDSGRFATVRLRAAE